MEMPKLRIDPLRQIDQPPAHHPVHRRVRTGLDDPPQSRALLSIQQRHLTRRLAVDQPLWAGRVERQHPVPHRLDPDAANPGRFAARPPLIDRCQRQQTPGLVRIPRRLGQRAQVLRVVILPKSHRQRHDTLPPYAMVKHTRGGLESLHKFPIIRISYKILAEAIAEDYRKHRNMNVITLRPRGFIPYWNRDVYAKYSDWARWFWKGAVHIDDVAAAVILSLNLISRQRLGQPLILTLDSAYEYTDADLADWDAEGPGSTFRKYYPKYYDLALSYGLDPALKPTRLDIADTVRWLGYKPTYSLANLLSELAAYGDSGPP